jgi:phage baseplate assembly protein W
MADIWHQFGDDLAVGVTGDLVPVSGTALGQQRVLRRLLTNPGDYIWHPDYGAGLGQFVGLPAQTAQIRAVIRSQILREAAVAASPEPTVDVQSDNTGTFTVNITYADAASGQTQLLTFSVGST